MYAKNYLKMLQVVGDGLVLDVGGWANPLPRADYVLDVLPYETRGALYQLTGNSRNSEEDSKERFTQDTWVIHDICSRKPLPFPDKKFDFVVCSHTLEDIRDPIHVAQELMRISKAGYIETPSRLTEQTKALNGRVGASHHRWFVEIAGNKIVFKHKPNFMHTKDKFYVPVSYNFAQPFEEKIAYLFWNDQFDVCEEIVHNREEEVAAFVASLNIPKRCYLKQRLGELIHPVRQALFANRKDTQKRSKQSLSLLKNETESTSTRSKAA